MFTIQEVIYKINAARLTLALSLIAALLPVHAKDELTLTTDVWPPYINEPGTKSGSAARLIEILLDYESTKSKWHYLPYEMSYLLVKEQQTQVAYPYFKTPQRATEVLYSDPVFTVTSRVYYNRQYSNAGSALRAYKNKKGLGKVAGYSYGASIDKDVLQAKSFANEKQALTALFNNEISLLPMTEGVMAHQLNVEFPRRKQLISAINSVADRSSLHVIASTTEQGQAVIDKINHALHYLSAKGMTSLRTTSSVAPDRVDVAKLVSSEGYPMIIGQTSVDDAGIQYYPLLQGSQVLIIEWSDTITKPSNTDRLYKSMMALSKVVLLNGPHVGKELYVRNMHLELL